MFEYLLNELVKLNTHMHNAGVPLILGGGMGLYLRDTCLENFGPRSPRYPQRPNARSTEDLDVLLSADIIADAEKMKRVRDIIRDTLDYQVKVENFQFERTIGPDAAGPTVGIDLLSAPPSPDREDQVKMGDVRARPHGVTGIHGRLTREAAGIDFGKIPIDLGALIETSAGNIETSAGNIETSTEAITELYIPSSFNYLILKLHAFHDRRERQDPKSDRGRHHAFDIFRIVSDMREEDWRSSEQHWERDRDEIYLRQAAHFRRDYFEDDTSEGILRLKENEGYRKNREQFEQYIPYILGDLRELFPVENTE